MKHNRIYLLWMALTVLSLHSGQIRAQVTIGSNVTPDANSLLDLKNQSNVNASTKGLLLPRVQLTATDNFAPLSTHVLGMVVYNTATAGTAPTNVTPGYYYNNGSKWIRLADAASPINLYTADGTLADNRTVTQADKTLAFTSSATTGTSHFTVDGTTFNVDAVNNRVGIGTATPSTKLDIQTGGTSAAPVPGFKLVDGNQLDERVLTSDGNGIATWGSPKGGVVTILPIPVQTLPFISTTVLSGSSYTVTSAGRYEIQLRFWATVAGVTTELTFPFHVRLLINGTPVDEYEAYASIDGTYNAATTFYTSLHTGVINKGDIIALDCRSVHIPKGATGIVFNNDHPWTTTKVVVKYE